MPRLQEDFYRLDAVEMAPRLLGKLLCRQLPDGQILRLSITETEAYRGEEDTACHAHKGRTPRTQVLYRPGGLAYVYLCYGIHSLLNVVSGPAEYPQAVLIRGVEGYNGPGKLTKAMFIDRGLNQEDLSTSRQLWIEDDGRTPGYTTAKRVGIDYADQQDIDRLWRFIAEK